MDLSTQERRLIRLAWLSLIILLLVAGVIAIGWFSTRHPRAIPAVVQADVSSQAIIRIGLVPERDIFDQRRRYQILINYLSDQLQQPIKLVTVNTYQAILDDFAQRRVEAAFMGSFVAVLTVNRLGAQVLVKPQFADGGATYHGTIFVPGDSPIESLADLAGRSIAMVRTTTAGDLFPTVMLMQTGLLAADKLPRQVWVGTHDQVIREVLAGRVDAGAVKNQRLDAYELSHPAQRVRRLAESAEAPNNALVLRADVAEDLGPRLRAVLLTMDEHPAGRAALAAINAERMLPCDISEYGTVFDLIDALGPHWRRLAIAGAPPRRPEPIAAPREVP